MHRTTILHRCLLAAATVCVAVATQQAVAIPIDGGVEGPVPDVFYNFYTPPVPVGPSPAMGAQLYVSPRPVPPRVGHTWITYPPFMPHEFLYQHRRKYVRPAGVTGLRTTVHGYWW
ncbi:MAG: hypothetical protein NZ658_01380 [Pirellulales bacterium]|nr:hypothetical protein [Pirellulales bacterium]